ncbi:MAG: acylneuraminate cytidylyltransferase family protein [Candidatus Omnitrophica bacterium]|jgi:N-acylneuraminate cytidylyltransferase/CMP-N,N'-diacetyllegionaminic acid synthase|nr:acylneuraminate cytidylyltransferase family protein [Candidatus Omnitrophota bacterium]
MSNIKFDQYKIIGVIPARGGSKGIRHKNIVPLYGKPLIEYTIEQALKSKFLDRIIVSTDSKRIAEVAKKFCKFGVEIFKRPKCLSQDSTLTVDVLRYLLKNIKNKNNYMPDIVVTLQPTSPFRKFSTIDRAIIKLIEGKYDSIITICKAERTPYKMYILKKGLIKPLLCAGKYIEKPRQIIPNVFRSTGTVYVTKSSLILKQKRIIGRKCSYIFVDRPESFDLDDKFDLKVARCIKKINRI